MTRTIVFTALIALALIANTNADQNASSTTQQTLSHRTTLDANGNTALMIAAAYGDLATTRALLNDGAQVNARSRIGNTALIYAAQEGHSQIVQLLLDAGADPQARNDYNATAGSLAQGYGHQDIAERIQAAAQQPMAHKTNNLI